MPLEVRVLIARPRRYEGKVIDYNFGSLIRTDCNEEYGERNTIFGEYTFVIEEDLILRLYSSDTNAGMTMPVLLSYSYLFPSFLPIVLCIRGTSYLMHLF
jgi:hypothetical protein